jgi:hypothetical protein
MGVPHRRTRPQSLIMSVLGAVKWQAGWLVAGAPVVGCRACPWEAQMAFFFFYQRQHWLLSALMNRF